MLFVTLRERLQLFLAGHTDLTMALSNYLMVVHQARRNFTS